MGCDRVGFVRDSFASVHATVFNCLVGVPNAMISGRKICVHGVEDEMRGNARAVMLHYAVYLGVHTYRKYMSIACATTCTVLLLFCSMVFRA